MMAYSVDKVVADMLTVRQLLSKACLKDAKIVAGEGGVDGITEKFGVLDAPDSTNFAVAGEFVVSSGFLFKNNDELQIQVVKKLIEIGAAAWALKFERYEITLCDEVYELANSHNFPIIAAPIEVTWYEIAEIIITADGKKDMEQANVYSVVENFLSQIRGMISLTELPSLIYDYFGYPCAMYHMSNQTHQICPQDSFSATALVGVLMSFEYNSPSYVAGMQNIISDNVKHLVKRVKINQMYFGHIIIRNHTEDADFPENVVEALNYILLSVQFRCTDIIGFATNDLVTRNVFLLNFLKKQVSASELASFRALASEHGITLNEKYVVVVSERVPSMGEDDEQDSNQIMGRIMQWLSTLNKKGTAIGGWVDLYTYFFLIPCQNISKSAIHSIVEGYVNNLQSLFNINNRTVITGVSPVTELAELNSGYLRAQRAILVGKKFDLGERFLYYSELELCNLIYETNLLKYLKTYYKQHIMPLEAFDAENGSELLKTLDVFLQNNRMVRGAAKELIVHHNTVRYRLQKIKTIGKLDLSNRTERVLIELCLLAYPIISSSSESKQF